MQLVIADTSPINYLILIGHIDILPALFQRVLLPSVVRDELLNGPVPVKNWITAPPLWIELRLTRQLRDDSMEKLDAGEADAIVLALELRADLLLMDDREGVIAAQRKGIEVAGTLGVLGLAAKRSLIDLAKAFALIKTTNFRYRQEIMDVLLAEVSGRV